jgi:hypothetical protein
MMRIKLTERAAATARRALLALLVAAVLGALAPAGPVFAVSPVATPFVADCCGAGSCDLDASSAVSPIPA